ncbi:MAG: hypothetical protein ACTSQ8_23975 [Candidatus Helarchaeota archaeon]
MRLIETGTDEDDRLIHVSIFSVKLIPLRRAAKIQCQHGINDVSIFSVKLIPLRHDLKTALCEKIIEFQSSK